eukprot:scaffold7500_cov127-Isochrysis_galbana.AAC.4
MNFQIIIASARVPIPALVRPSQHGAGQGQAVPKAVARAENCTWVELSSVLSTRTRLRPLSAPISASMGSSRSWRGAIV